jgi:putative transposase
MKDGINPSHVQRDFLKYTSQQIKFDLQKNHPKVLEHFKVKVKDRHYQIWEHLPRWRAFATRALLFDFI